MWALFIYQLEDNKLFYWGETQVKSMRGARQSFNGRSLNKYFTESDHVKSTSIKLFDSFQGTVDWLRANKCENA
jgi:hypothetical protein